VTYLAAGVWHVSLVFRSHVNIGVHFVAPPRPTAVLNDRFTAVVSAATAVGQPPELDRISFVHAPADLKALDGPHADYLAPLVDRYTRILL
jgi:hypothetical protein